MNLLLFLFFSFLLLFFFFAPSFLFSLASTLSSLTQTTMQNDGRTDSYRAAVQSSQPSKKMTLGGVTRGSSDTDLDVPKIKRQFPTPTLAPWASLFAPGLFFF